MLEEQQAGMRLVSNNSGDEVTRRKALRDLGIALRKLAANILRISRGAGKPYELGLDLAECIDGYRAYHDAHGFYPLEHEIARMLDYEHEWPASAGDDKRGRNPWREDMEEFELLRKSRDRAERAMQRASLQMVAAMLVGQDLQRRRGQDSLEAAIRHYKDAEKHIDQYWAAKRAAEMPGKPGKRLKSASARMPKHVATRPAPEPATEPATEAPATRHALPAAAPRPSKPDPFQPPPYSHLRQAPMTDAIRDEFDVVTALDLVHRLNALWREEGRRPLPQGNFPEREASLQWVVKELRRARARAAERACPPGRA